MDTNTRLHNAIHGIEPAPQRPEDRCSIVVRNARLFEVEHPDGSMIGFRTIDQARDHAANYGREW